MRKGIILDLLIKTVKPNKSPMFDQDLQNAYEKAIYEIFDPPISWSIGGLVPAIDALLEEHQITTACLITAHNPKSIIVAVDKNQEQQDLLVQFVEQNEWTYFIGQGNDSSGSWPSEDSLLILGLNEIESTQLGRKFEQNAVVFLEIGKPAQLLFCTH